MSLVTSKHPPALGLPHAHDWRLDLSGVGDRSPPASACPGMLIQKPVDRAQETSMQGFVTYREALDALRISDRTLRRYLARLELVPHRATNGRVFLHRDQLVA